MITILYNTETNKPISIYLSGGYKVDGKPQAVLHPIVELEVITTARPEILDTQKTSSEWVADLELNQYRLEWTVTDKTEEEIIADFESAALQAEEILKEKALERIAEPEIELIYTEAILLTDEQAQEQVDLFPPYRVGVAYETGNRFQWNGKLWKVLQNHTSSTEWRPDEAVSLYEHVYVAPPGDPCDTAELWDGANWGSYTVGYVVKHEGAIYEAKNTTHTWIAPAKTGDGAISWTWIKDCTI